MKDIANISKIKGTRKRKRVNSRTKGNAFERKVCSLLNNRFATDNFCRSPGSGAFASTHKLPEHLKIYGDLITPENFKFTIECKKGYNKENLCSFFKPKSEIRKFIKQSEKDAKFSKREPMIIFQQDRNTIIVITRRSSYEWDVCEESSIETKLIYKDYVICPLEELLKVGDEFFFTA
tara:strand:+ start:5982 stop:6515 length:534 start_codon:yes stop_codon:yes gene_type:complete